MGSVAHTRPNEAAVARISPSATRRNTHHTLKPCRKERYCSSIPSCLRCSRAASCPPRCTAYCTYHALLPCCGWYIVPYSTSTFSPTQPTTRASNFFQYCTVESTRDPNRSPNPASWAFRGRDGRHRISTKQSRFPDSQPPHFPYPRGPHSCKGPAATIYWCQQTAPHSSGQRRRPTDLDDFILLIRTATSQLCQRRAH